MDVQLVQTGSTPENVDQDQEQHVRQKTDKQQTESKQSETLEAEVSQSFQTAAPCADLQAEIQLLTAETTDAETGEPQPVSPQKQSLSGDDSTPAQPKPMPKCSSSEKPKEKQKASPVLEQPLRRPTRRQLELEPYGKKLRSSSTQAVRTTSSPQPLKKTKSALQQDTTTDQPAPKKARGKTPRAAAESDEEQSTPAAISKTIQAGMS